VVTFGQPGHLLRKAFELLERGPLSTPELATRLLGSTGNPGAAAGAVWALLADDSRFTVDTRGIWALCRTVAPIANTLRQADFVVVDVETTGGSPASGHRITEIAAVCVSGGEIRERWSSLVNPERRIPHNITVLTGITHSMVAGAPRFGDIVPSLLPFLNERVFVAHNAGFDWSFVSAEMQRATCLLSAERQLCTVRLARKLLPQLPSRSLGNLADYFGLEITSRHRALDDAVATARVLLHFIEMLEEREIADWAAMEEWLARRAPRRKRSFFPRPMDSA
jgi:DNA polymerase-3 subunit epsilon